MSADSARAEASTDQTESPRAIAKDAYLYAFAMLENCQTMYKQAADARAPEYVGGFGHYRHYSEREAPQPGANQVAGSIGSGRRS